MNINKYFSYDKMLKFILFLNFQAMHNNNKRKLYKFVVTDPRVIKIGAKKKKKN